MARCEALPDRGLVVLSAVVDACKGVESEDVPTSAVARQLRACGGHAGSARTLLRALSRRGFVRRVAGPGQQPARWAPTAKGRARLTADR